MTTSQDTSTLTRAEDAYAHLASFAKGDRVDVAGPEFFQPGTVIAAQEDGHRLEDSFLYVKGCGLMLPVTVAMLLAGERTITLAADAAAGNIRYFDEAGYAAQNG